MRWTVANFLNETRLNCLMTRLGAEFELKTIGVVVINFKGFIA
jgi:hypothetical protein